MHTNWISAPPKKHSYIKISSFCNVNNLALFPQDPHIWHGKYLLGLSSLENQVFKKNNKHEEHGLFLKYHTEMLSLQQNDCQQKISPPGDVSATLQHKWIQHAYWNIIASWLGHLLIYTML